MLTEAWLRQGHATTFVQVPSYRTACQRLIAPLRRRASAPVVRPWPIRPCRWWNPADEIGLRRRIKKKAAGLRRQLEKQLDISQSTAIVISPVWTPWLDELPFKHVIYDCIDDVSVHVPRSDLAALYEQWEDELVQRITGVAVTAEPLIESLRARRADVPIATIRNGVDVDRFETLARELPRPADVPAGQRPMIGFVGALYEWIDWKLIAGVARGLPEYDFVFVGPHDGRSSTELLAGAANVAFLGSRPYDRVPAYMKAFDVCWVPFDQSRVSKAANPVKIYEYLALGKPVVSTPVADTDSFAGLIRVGSTVDEIVAHLRTVLAQKDQATDDRIRFAKASSWDSRAREYVAFIDALGK